MMREPTSAATLAVTADAPARPQGIPRVNVLGVGIHAVNFSSALAAAFWAARTAGVRGYITATGVHGIMESQDDPALKAIHNQSLLSLPDGAPMAWVGRLNGYSTMDLVGGPDFMRAVFASADEGCRDRHYLWGGGPGVAAAIERNLVARHPRACVVGVETPPFSALTDDEERQLVERINRVRPNFFWVGLSTPKQERFMAGFLARHGKALNLDDQGFVMVGVGAAFDIEAGRVIEAPLWIRRSGFAWLYRLAKEPRRLWKRYFRNNPRFIGGMLLQMLIPGRYGLHGYNRSSPFDI